MIYRYFQTLENELLLHSYAFFSTNQLQMTKRRLDLERNPMRKNFTNYLQAIICFFEKDYPKAHALFAAVEFEQLPRKSFYFAKIYQAITKFLISETGLHQDLERLKAELSDDYYAYLLAKLIILLHQNPTHRARSFYLRLQLSTILPHLPATLFVAHLYYELGQFYLFVLPNEQIALQCLMQTKKVLESVKDEPFQIMTDLSLAYAHSLRPTSANTQVHLYETIPWTDRKMKTIDPFHYYNAALTAAHYFIIHQQLHKAHQLLPILEQITHVSDPQKQALLQFKGHCLQLTVQLSEGETQAQAFAQTLREGELLLTKLDSDLLFGFHQLQWLHLRAKIAYQTKDYQSATAYLKTALELSLLEQHTNVQIELHQLASQAYAAREKFQTAIYHFEAADELLQEFRQQQHQHALLALNTSYHDKTFELSLVDALYTHEQLQNQVTTDNLTGLGNRQALAHAALQLQQQEPIAVAMLDLDFFKKYNDHYGHLAGDEILRQFAQLLKLHFPQATLIRYGGEEFTIIVAHLEMKTFSAQLKNFQRALTQKRFAHEGIGPEALVSASIGYTYSQQYLPLDTLIQRADQALYHAKASGRSRIEQYQK